MPEIALVTYLESPELTPDDQLLADALRQRGATPRAVPWDSAAEWSSFDLVVLRSPWDYYLRAAEFAAWIDRLEALGVALVNPYAVVRWNGDKRYLIELERAGIEIVPTILIERDADHPSLAGLLAERGWNEAVVKPVVSAGGHATWRASLPTAPDVEARFHDLREATTGGVFVQPFMPEVIAAGEWSLLFVDGAYSHAAIKRPQAGNFLVQHVHGGTYAPATPHPQVVADAQRVLEVAAACAGVRIDDLAYARVDGVVQPRDGVERLVLMELECLEPSLFLLQATEAADRFARSLAGRALANGADGTYLR